MSLTMTFLGSGSAFTVGDDNFHSNVLLRLNGDSLLIDAGTDLKHALYALNLTYRSVRNVYISHLHSDHIGGLEWLALSNFFAPDNPGKPGLFVSGNIMNDLWAKALSGGLSTLRHCDASLSTYFTVHAVDTHNTFVWQGIPFTLIPMKHVFNNECLMGCYGLFFQYQGVRILFTADTQFTPDTLYPWYEMADMIFHDCETGNPPSGVHAHYTQLVKLPAELKKKMWLYHYTTAAKRPNAQKDGFQGFVARGQTFMF